MDAAREWTDGELERLELRMAREYGQAAREMRDRQEQALREYARELEQREKALDDAPDAMAAHEAWLRGQAAKLTRLGAMSDQLAAAASEANRRAAAMVNDSLPAIFAENANRAAFEVDGLVGRDTAFSLVDESTVRHLMGLGDRDVINREVVYEIEPGMEPVQSIRRAEFEEAKDIRWNRQKFASAITQGILQGESIPDIVKRTEEIFNSNRKAAVRAARTACTSAENAGRVGSYSRADRLGIPLVQEWMATLDGRTRGSHRALDGERVEVGGEFSNGCRYPGDPHGPASEVWNCRCTIRAMVKGFEDEPWEDRWSRLPEGMTYEEWKAGKDLRPRPASEPARGAAPRQAPARTKYTMAELRGMSRPELERVARAVAAEHAPAQGVSEAEALRRFDMLVDGNSDAQLRKYINQHGKTPGAVRSRAGGKANAILGSGSRGAATNEMSYLGTTDRGDANVVAATVRQCKDLVREERVEHAYAILGNGDVYHGVGNLNSVNVGGLDLQDAILVHNHVILYGESMSFGEDDFYVLKQNPGIGELWAVNSEYEYWLKPMRPLDMSYNYAWRHGLDFSDDDDAQHNVMGWLQHEGYIEYTREEI